MTEKEEYLIPYSEFIKAYKECRRAKRMKKSALQYERMWIYDLPILCDEVNNMTYEIGESITFVVSKPKRREVFAADFRDRIVHHLLCSRLIPLFDQYFIDDTYNCRKGMGTLYGIKRLYAHIKEISENYTKDCWVAKFDMRGFFMSIDKGLLWKKLKAFITEKYNGNDKQLILWLTEKIAMHSPEKHCVKIMSDKAWEHLPDDKSLFTNGNGKGLPIGNLTSQIFANFYLTDFDKMMTERFEAYGRYVDDFYIVTKDKRRMMKFIPVIRKELLKLSITLHPSKVYVQHYKAGMAFTGGVCKPGRKYIANRTIHNCMLAINNFNNYEINSEAILKFTETLNSYLGFMRHHNNYAVRRQIIKSLHNDIWKYAYICGHFEYMRVKQQYTEEFALKQRFFRNKTKKYSQIKRYTNGKKHYSKITVPAC